MCQLTVIVKSIDVCQFIELLEKEHDANQLALCPNCVADFQYACQTDEDQKAELILDLDPTINETEIVVPN